jgi:Sigma-70, region 4
MAVPTQTWEAGPLGKLVSASPAFSPPSASRPAAKVIAAASALRPSIAVTTPSLPSTPVKKPSVPPVPVKAPSVPPTPVSTPSVPPPPVSTPTVPHSPVSTPSVSPVPVTTPTPPAKPPVTVSTPPTRPGPIRAHDPSRSPAGAVSGAPSTSSHSRGASSHGAVPNSDQSPASAPGGSSASSAYGGSGGSSGSSAAGKSPSRAGSAAGHQQASMHAHKLSLRATVKLLQSCLSDLPNRLRLVLELRTGLHVPHALSPSALAGYLHIPAGRISHLERRALRRLRQTARTHFCGASSQRPAAGVSGGPLSGFGSSRGSGPAGGALGGVKAVHYTKEASSPRHGKSGGGDSSIGNILGTDIFKANDSLSTALLILAAMLVIGGMFADALGMGPRHPEWRRRWMHRRSWWR